jgi:transposase InsO family protein
MEEARAASVIGCTVRTLGRWAESSTEQGACGAPSNQTDRPAATKGNGGRVASAKQATKSGPRGKKLESKKSKRSAKTGSGSSAARSPYAPHDPAHGLSPQEVAAVLELKEAHLSMGPAQIRAQLKRFKGWRLSVKAIARILVSHGYERVHTRSRPQGQEPVRFEAPRRNAIWQADYCEVRITGQKLYLLIIIDDFSRYVVGHSLSDSPTSEVATSLLYEAMARHGKPESIRTDRGGAFVAFSKESDFGKVLEAELIDHIVGKPYKPQGGGKVEAVVKTLRRELLDVEHLGSPSETKRRISEFFCAYNERRAHMGIDGLTPADRFHGRAEQVLETVNALSRRRQSVLDQLAGSGGPIEEVSLGAEAAPTEILRIGLVDGKMELRFCGARVCLGPVTP